MSKLNEKVYKFFKINAISIDEVAKTIRFRVSDDEPDCMEATPVAPAANALAARVSTALPGAGLLLVAALALTVILIPQWRPSRPAGDSKGSPTPPTLVTKQ